MTSHRLDVNRAHSREVAKKRGDSRPVSHLRSNEVSLGRSTCVNEQRLTRGSRRGVGLHNDSPSMHDRRAYPDNSSFPGEIASLRRSFVGLLAKRIDEER